MSNINIKQDYVNYKNNGWGYYSMSPSEITVHNTANDASAQNERDYVNNRLSVSNSGVATYHYSVDDKGAIQLLPHNVNGWHAGDGNGSGNRNSIGIEICYSKSGGDKYEKAQRNAFILMAKLIKDGVISGTNKIYMHRDRSGKHCPHRIIDAHKDPLGFIRAQVDAELGNVTSGNNGGNSGDDSSLSFNYLYDLTDNKADKTRILRGWVEGSYPNDIKTFGYKSMKATGGSKYNKNDSNQLIFPENVGKYYGYYVCSKDGIIWFLVSMTINGKYWEFYLDLNKAYDKKFYNETKCYKTDNQSNLNG